MSILPVILWKDRRLRRQIHLLRARYHQAAGGFATGLGPSVWGLHGLVRALHPQTCVEIGSARGWTRPIEFLFIDGDHSYAGVQRDWALFSPFLTEFGVAVFHDTTWERHGPNRPDMGVPRLVDELRRNGYPVITIDRDCGLSLVQTRCGGVPLAPE